MEFFRIVLLGIAAAALFGIVHDQIILIGVPGERYPLFLADLCAHAAAYGAAFVGGLILCTWVWRKRRRFS